MKEKFFALLSEAVLPQMQANVYGRDTDETYDKRRRMWSL